MSRKHSTRFINDESHVPDGYVPLASFGHNTRIHRALCDAHRDGRVRAVKLVRHEGDIKTGAVWVHEGDAAEFRDAYESPQPKAIADSAVEAIGSRHAESVCESLSSIDATLDEIYRVLERLTTAAESIATQPKAEPAGLWRDMNGESH